MVSNVISVKTEAVTIQKVRCHELSEVKKWVECIRICLKGVGFRGVSRLTGALHTTVMCWVHALAKDVARLRPQVEVGKTISTLEIDELWYFIRKKNKCWVWLVYDREKKRTCAMQLWQRNT